MQTDATRLALPASAESVWERGKLPGLSAGKVCGVFPGRDIA